MSPSEDRPTGADERPVLVCRTAVPMMGGRVKGLLVAHHGVGVRDCELTVEALGKLLRADNLAMDATYAVGRLLWVIHGDAREADGPKDVRAIPCMIVDWPLKGGVLICGANGKGALCDLDSRLATMMLERVGVYERTVTLGGKAVRQSWLALSLPKTMAEMTKKRTCESIYDPMPTKVTEAVKEHEALTGRDACPLAVRTRVPEEERSG